MQDFTKMREDSSFVDAKMLDESETGVAYREALFMGDKDPNKAYEKAKVGRLGKAAINYDAKQEHVGSNVA